MKAIIFDLDDTLINWKKEFIFAEKAVLKDMNYNFSEELINKISDSIDENEKHHNKLTREELLEFINKSCDLNLPLEFIDKLIEAQKECVYEDKELVDTIKYLSDKYDLYIVTNWFTETQKGRLERVGILKYFKGVYGGDINYIKPDIRAFNIILDKYDSKDCISIGDFLEGDVIPPLELGMDAIWKTNKVSDKYKTIKELKELKDIL